MCEKLLCVFARVCVCVCVWVDTVLYLFCLRANISDSAPDRSHLFFIYLFILWNLLCSFPGCRRGNLNSSSCFTLQFWAHRRHKDLTVYCTLRVMSIQHNDLQFVPDLFTIKEHWKASPRRFVWFVWHVSRWYHKTKQKLDDAFVPSRPVCCDSVFWGGRNLRLIKPGGVTWLLLRKSRRNFQIQLPSGLP